MKRLLPAVFLLLLPGLLPAADLRISAAASLSETLTEISRLHRQLHGGKVRLNFAGSNVLARQIEAGAPTDLFFSADEATMDSLLSKNLVRKETITPLLANRLVVIVPKNHPLEIGSAADLASTRIRRLALGDPAAVPAGVYARAWLENQGQWENVRGKVVGMENVRGALAAVAGANAEAGIVYRTDAMISPLVSVAFIVPPAEAPAIRYPVAVCRSSSDPGRAKTFIAFLQTEKASRIFEKHGFIVISNAEE